MNTDISIVILAFNEEKNIKACLDAAVNQKYDGGNWEIVVVDGDSTDNTVKIINDFQKGSNRIRLIINKKRKIAPGRNLGIKESQYPFIAFTDSDCTVPFDWLSRLNKEYINLSKISNKVAGIGGGNLPPSSSSEFHGALGIYLDSFLGSFNSPQGRNFLKAKKVNSLPCNNVFYNKEIVLAAGGFDEKLGNVSEDYDLNYRLRQRGFELYFIPNLTVIHKLRSNLRDWLKNMALYGRGRAIVSFKHKHFLNIFFILPLCFIISFFLVPFGFINRIFFLPILYFPIVTFYALILSLKKRKLSLFVRTLIIFISTHFVYAFNLLTKSLKICYENITN